MTNYLNETDALRFIKSLNTDDIYELLTAAGHLIQDMEGDRTVLLAYAETVIRQGDFKLEADRNLLTLKTNTQYSEELIVARTKAREAKTKGTTKKWLGVATRLDRERMLVPAHRLAHLDSVEQSRVKLIRRRLTSYIEQAAKEREEMAQKIATSDAYALHALGWGAGPAKAFALASFAQQLLEECGDDDDKMLESLDDMRDRLTNNLIDGHWSLGSSSPFDRAVSAAKIEAARSFIREIRHYLS